MFNKTSLFQGFKDCSQRGTDQRKGDALAHSHTLQLWSSSSDILTTSFQKHSVLYNEKKIKSKVLKHFALSGLSVTGKNEAVPMHGYIVRVTSIMMMGHLTTVTVFESGQGPGDQTGAHSSRTICTNGLDTAGAPAQALRHILKRSSWHLLQILTYKSHRRTCPVHELHNKSR